MAYFNNLEKPHRPKTFANETTANSWAKENKVEKYHLESVKKGKRFMVVQE